MTSGGFPWRTIALASAAANLLVLGAMAGGYAAGARVVPAAALEQQSATTRVGGRGALQALSQDERRAMRAALAQAWRGAKAERAERFAARRALLEIAAREPYDPAAMQAGFARMRAADAALQARLHGAIAEALGEVSPERREAALRAAAAQRGGRSRE